MVSKFLRSFVYAWQGIIAVIATQQNFRVQLLVAMVAISAGLFFDVNKIEWCVILIFIALVMCLEMVNSAVEDLVNMVSPQRRPEAGRIKDIAAGAVLLASIIACVAGILIFAPYVREYFSE